MAIIKSPPLFFLFFFLSPSFLLLSVLLHTEPTQIQRCIRVRWTRTRRTRSAGTSRRAEGHPSATVSTSRFTFQSVIIIHCVYIGLFDNPKAVKMSKNTEHSTPINNGSVCVGGMQARIACSVCGRWPFNITFLDYYKRMSEWEQCWHSSLLDDRLSLITVRYESCRSHSAGILCYICVCHADSGYSEVCWVSNGLLINRKHCL